MLDSYLKERGALAVAFSGGTDSAYLLYMAAKSGIRVRAYYVKTAFQPQFELNDALRFAKQIGVDIAVLEYDILSNAEVIRNDCNRCYFCKKAMLSLLLRAAEADGFTLLADGTNSSDDAAERAGMRALSELNVVSPLRECGLTKDFIRALSHEAGLFTWNKPAYACLATRIASGECITKDKLTKTEQAEDYLFSLGFSDFRVRLRADAAVLQLTEAQLPNFYADKSVILTELEKIYGRVMPEAEVRR